MVTIAHAEPAPIAVPILDRCPAGCDLNRAVACWLRRRELLAELAAARASDDAEVFAQDLAAAEYTIDHLIKFGRRPA